MALQNQIDPDVAKDVLTAWVQERLPDAHDVRVENVTIPKANGLSSESVVFDATWTSAGEQHHQGLVARVAPAGEGIYPDYDFPRESRLMRALAEHTPVPAPTLWSSAGDELFGAPAIVMERIPGQVPPDDPPYPVAGWVLDLEPAQQAELVEGMIRVLVDVHAVDWRGLGLHELAPQTDGATPLDEEFRYWEAYYAWGGQGQRSSVIDAGLEWCRANRPTGEGPAVLSWGDARLGNVMYAEDRSVVGAFDWEMATVGAPALDLNWFLFQLRHHSAGFGVPLPPGFPNEAAIVARYEELSGRPVEHLRFYRVWTGVRSALMMLRIGRAMIELGAIPAGADLPVNNICTSLLAEDLGIPRPEFATAGWLDGSR